MAVLAGDPPTPCFVSVLIALFAAPVAADGRFLVEHLPLWRVASLFLRQRLIAAPHPLPSGALVADLQQLGERAWVPSSGQSVLSAKAIPSDCPPIASPIFHTRRRRRNASRSCSAPESNA